MSERRSWVGHHDFASSGVLRHERKHNQELLEAKFHQDLNLFRARTTEKMSAHGDLSGKGSIAIFSQEIHRPDQPPSRANTLISLAPCIQDSAELTPPAIRIIKNEIVLSKDSGEILTYDFIADEDNDVQYLVDAYNPAQAAQDGDSRHTFAPVFEVRGGKLVVTSNFTPFTPVMKLDGVEMGLNEESVLPLGSFKHLEDKIHALSIGESLLEGIVNQDPVYTKTL